MEKIISKIANFFSVKAVIALVLTGVYSYLAVTGKIESEAFENIFILVVGFYFGQTSIKTPTNTNGEG